MMKHLPEGITPFEDCGYARYPLFPLENADFEVGCLAEDETCAPALCWSVDGASQPELAPYRAENERYRFRLSGLPYGAAVTYAFRAGNERTKDFTAPICREHVLGQPTALLGGENVALLRFAEGLRLLIEAGDTLRMRWSFADEATALAPCEQVTLPLPEGFSVTVSRSDCICVLKRLSQPELALDSLRVLVDGDGAPLRLTQAWRWQPGHVWGTGERFDAVDQRGRGTNGRVVEKFTQQGEQTYLPVPFLMTDRGFGLWRQGSIPAAMRFDDRLTVEQRVGPSGYIDDEVFFGKPASILRQFIARTGKPVLPPEWSFGVWTSANGWSNDAEVEAQLAALEAHDYPASVMVLEAWSDERTFYRWNADGSWADPAQTVRRIREAGLHLLLWQIPIIKYEWDGDWGEALRQDEREAIERGYCVRNADGTPYRVTDNWFKHSLLLDFTNPEAVRWWFGKRKYLLDMGVEGFKTDGGEFLFADDARLCDGARGLEAHNLYPGQYVGAYHDFLRQNGVNGLTFSRAGFAGAQTQPMHWAGDQLSLWSELKSQLNAGISAGLSGVLFWGFDVGGFAGELPTKELYLRATAMACFCPVMQWHAEPRDGQFYRSHEKGFNNDRSPWNLAEKLGDPEVLTVATAYARLRERLRPYLWREARHCVDANRPLMAHLCLDYPDDERACATDDAYMLGRSLLVAPITDEGANDREVYLPQGEWTDSFTGERFAGGASYRVACGLERIPVYQKREGGEPNERA